jgi:hypothetical protein
MKLNRRIVRRDDVYHSYHYGLYFDQDADMRLVEPPPEEAITGCVDAEDVDDAAITVEKWHFPDGLPTNWPVRIVVTPITLQSGYPTFDDSGYNVVEYFLNPEVLTCCAPTVEEQLQLAEEILNEIEIGDGELVTASTAGRLARMVRYSLAK